MGLPPSKYMFGQAAGGQKVGASRRPAGGRLDEIQKAHMVIMYIQIVIYVYITPACD